MLEKEFQYFVSHQKELVKQFKGKFLVIVGEKVIGVYNTIEDAYKESLEKYAAGTFFIQECIPGKDAYTQTFNSRVIFA
jgi:hypothetical protein